MFGYLQGVVNLDAAIAILTPEHYVAPRRHHRRECYFKRGELIPTGPRSHADAGKPLAAGEIAAGIIAAKHFRTPHTLPSRR